MLADTGFLSSASEALRTAIEAHGREMRLGAGEVLFEQGDDGDALYAILDGALEISVVSEDGRKLALDVLKPGDLIGEIAFFDPGVRTATATAHEDTRLFRIRNRDMTEAIRADPALGIDMIHLAGQRMRWMNSQLADQVFLPLSARLARKLLHLTADGTETLHMSKSEIAEFMGATREAVSKTIGDWKKAGIVEAPRGVLTITDRAALKALSQPDLF
ncbi:MAG: Crp/Fnr family transcriptional regulator [Paracoccaceae bacterium]|nr:Crp/Fnr family transcriptional regulator [Paracoccaceae bacterium]